MAGIAPGSFLQASQERLERDAQAVLRYYQANEAFLKPWEPVKPAGFYSEEYWLERCRRNLAEFHSGESARFFLFPKDRPDEVIGGVNFTAIVRGAFHACFLGYSLSEREQGQGYMTEALTAALRFAFEGLKLHRIGANYMPRNARSAALLARLGFVIEGKARDYLLIDGKWEDHVLTSLTNPDWGA